MGIKGALIGGGLGLFVGGPIGAIIGAILGGTVTGSATTVNTSERNQVAFFVCFFSCLAKLAKADGIVSQEEIDYVEDVMDNKFRLDPQTKDIAKRVFIEAKDNTTPASAYITQFGQIVNYDRELCMMLVNTLIELSKRDGKSSPQEQVIIEDAQRILHLRSGSYRSSSSGGRSYSSSASTSNELDDAYELLECSSSDSDSEIKKKYRDKCAAFHPDKLQSKGLPEEFMKFATEQMTKVNKAYDTIMKSRA